VPISLPYKSVYNLRTLLYLISRSLHERPPSLSRSCVRRLGRHAHAGSGVHVLSMGRRRLVSSSARTRSQASMGTAATPGTTRPLAQRDRCHCVRGEGAYYPRVFTRMGTIIFRVCSYCSCLVFVVSLT
jgi:uncharacterized Zn-finger protein